MDLADIRTEVLAHGFGKVQFPAARLNQYANEGYAIINRRSAFYQGHSSQQFVTVAQQNLYPWPADLIRIRSLHNTDENIMLKSVFLDDLDRSNPTTQGKPYCYALNGTNVQLYPTPDTGYNLMLRYAATAPPLINDNDEPWLPDEWQSLIVYYMLKRCYAGDDDMQQAQYWESQFNTMLSEFAADVKFPSVDAPKQVRGMWEQDTGVGSPGWGSYWGW